jgi:hypothetical protein
VFVLEPTRLAHELTNALVARPRVTEALGFCSDQSIDLRDRKRLVGEVLDEK